MDEKQAIQILIKHEPAGLVWLVDHYQVKALRTAFLIIGERQQAEDVVQEVCIDLPDLIRSFDPERPFAPWFMRVVVNRSLRSCLHQQRWVRLPDRDETDAWLETLIDPIPGPEEKLQQSEQAALLWDHLRALNSEQRAAIVMRYYLQMSEQEMAEITSVPAGTIKWRLSAARGQLRKLIKVDPRKEEE